MEEINHYLFLKLNSMVGINSFLDLIIKFSGEYFVFLFVLVEVFLYFYLKKRNIAFFAFLTSMLGLCLNQISGLLYFHNRPFMDNLGKTLVNHVQENSFPSDHTTLMFSIAIYLYVKMENKVLGESLISIALYSGLSRVAMGVHYPFDVLGSIIIAVVSSLFVLKLENKLQFLINFVFSIEKKIFKKV